MRVFVDTNIYIAYLLNPHYDSFVQALFEAVVNDDVTLLISYPLLDEIEATVKRKPHLLEKIPAERLTRFVELLKAISEDVPLISAEIPPITRDPKDDFLVAYAVLGQADYLISGDKDLLVLERVGNISIVRSGEFRTILQEALSKKE